MGFRINTNIGALNAHANATINNRSMDSSLSKLSSGLRINNAADDASGMAIADSLRSQASSLGQAVSNANDAIGIVQIADKAMDVQSKILDTIKTKATQAAQDGQSTESRKSLQADISRLVQSLDNIANSTNYNGQNLLSGAFTNKQFQIGAYSNETVNASIGSTQSTKIGAVSYLTGSAYTAQGGSVTLTFSANGKDVALEAVTIDYSAGTGMGKLASVINNATGVTGVRASYVVETVMSQNIADATNVSGLKINGINIGDFSAAANDKDGQLVNAINAVTAQTGVTASVDTLGFMHLKSNDGRGIVVSTSAAVVGLGESDNMGRLTLSRLDSRAIVVSSAADGAGIASGGTTFKATMNLADALYAMGSTEAKAAGFLAYSGQADKDVVSGLGAGVTTLKGAMAVMDIAESAQKLLSRIRSDLGSVQSQLVSTVNNISVTQVNVRAAESQIRDVDFAEESANFNKYNILAQSGSYAMSQANAVQQNVLKLLQ